MKISHEELKARQSLPLDVKIEFSGEIIRRVYELLHGKIYVAFSGGLDSTVLLHIARSIYPDIPALNVASLPYPENADFVRRTKGVTILRPSKPFSWVLERHGYPVVSKRIAQYVKEVQHAKGDTATKRLRLTGIKSNGEYSKMGKIPQKWQYLCDAPFKIGDRCCFWMKKRELDKARKQFGHPLIGIRAQESEKRRASYLQYGCNALEIRQPRSWPLAFWSDNDVLQYIEAFNVAYSALYDMGYERSGCFPCMFGVPYEDEPNRFQLMQETHPKLWKACEAWGIPEVLDYIGVPYR